MSRDLKVFVSSTSKDLQDYRAVARLAVLDLDWKPEMMEHFGARPEPTIQACREMLEKCDLVVLLVAFSRGTVPGVEQGGNGVDSYTALELDFARSKGIPVLAFLANEEKWPGKLWEDKQDARDWVKAFRARVNLSAVFFDLEEMGKSEADQLPIFRAKVKEALMQHRERLRAAAATTVPKGVDFSDNAVNALAQGTCLPLLGACIFGDGPLSAEKLASALRKEQVSNEPCLATAAEYLEKLRGSREKFLLELTQILEEQSAQAAPTPIHELIAMLQLKPPPLVVSTTLDLTFENKLEAAGARYTIVCHVLRSKEGKHDGKIAVLRQGKPAAYCWSDELELGGEQFVIYKPLGSPLLHPRLEAEIDTVVVTESDHVQFLRRLQNEHTRVPEVFVGAFQDTKRDLLFLGYQLDEWQYRLVAQVFNVAGTGGFKGAPVAVRQPASPMEALAWKRLGVDLIPEDPNAFARNAASIVAARRRMSHAA